MYVFIKLSTSGFVPIHRPSQDKILKSHILKYTQKMAKELTD